MDGQREEVLTFLHALGGSDRTEHNGFAICGEDRAVSLTGNVAGFQSEGLSAPLQRYGFRVEHVFSLMTRTALLRCGAYCAGYSVPVRYEAFFASLSASAPDCAEAG